MCGNCDIKQPDDSAIAPEVVIHIDANNEAESVKRIEKLVATMKLDFMDVRHTFANGVYTRTGRVKAGQFIIGTKHRAKNYLHIAKGKVAVWDNINGFRILTAPHTEVSFPGIQRIGYVLEDFEGSNIFETDKTTPEEVEAEMLFPLVVPENIGEKIFNLAVKATKMLCA